MKIRALYLVAAAAFSLPVMAQHASKTPTADVTLPPRLVADMPAEQGMVRTDSQDSRLSGGTVIIPPSWTGTFDGGGGSGSGSPPPAVLGAVTSGCTLRFPVGMGFSQVQSGCQQGGVYTKAAYSDGVAYADFSIAGVDPSLVTVSWSGDCSGSGLTCKTVSKQISWQIQAFFSARAHITAPSTGEARDIDILGEVVACGLVDGATKWPCP